VITCYLSTGAADHFTPIYVDRVANLAQLVGRHGVGYRYSRWSHA